METAIKDFDNSKLNELQYKARITLQTKGFTDPRIIPPGKKNDEVAIRKLLKSKAKAAARLQAHSEDLATNLGALWNKSRESSKHDSSGIKHGMQPNNTKMSNIQAPNLT